MRTKDRRGFNNCLHLLRRRWEKNTLKSTFCILTDCSGEEFIWGSISVFISFRRRRFSPRCFRPPSVGDLLSRQSKNNRVDPQLCHCEHPGVVSIPQFPTRRCLAPIRVTGACGRDPGRRDATQTTRRKTGTGTKPGLFSVRGSSAPSDIKKPKMESDLSPLLRRISVIRSAATRRREQQGA